MDHAAEGTLQAYLDGEIDGAAEGALRDHVVACAACAGELEVLREAGRRTGEALALLDVPAPMLKAQAAMARERRSGRRSLRGLGTASLAKAAMLLLVLAGAGAAAIPDVRRAFETTIARVAQLFTGSERAEPVPTMPAPVDASAATESSLSFVTPADGQVRIVLHVLPEGTVEVVARLTDAARAEVETASVGGPVRLRSGNGRLEVMDLGTGTVTIGIPRGVSNASIEIDGEVRVYKDGETLRLSGPGAEGRGSEVRFSIDS